MGRLLKKEANLIVAKPFDYHDKTPQITLTPRGLYRLAFGDARNWNIQQLAGELDKHIQCVLEMRPECIELPIGIDHIDRVDIVAHSMGGLITRAYIAGMAVDRSNNNQAVKYRTTQDGSKGVIRKVITTGTPHYGAALTSRTDLFAGTRPSGVEQIKQMEFGSGFLWELNERWKAVKKSDLEELLAIAGTQDDGAYEGDDDGIVNVASAALPRAFLDDKHLRYVPYGHFSSDLPRLACQAYRLTIRPRVPVSCVAFRPFGGPTLVGVDRSSHKTYVLVREFLQGHAIREDYKPPQEFLDDGLLLMRAADTETKLPVAISSKNVLLEGLNPNPSFPNRDAGTLTVWPLPANPDPGYRVWLDDNNYPAGYKYPQPLEQIAAVLGARPTVLEPFILTPVADLVINALSPVIPPGSSCATPGTSLGVAVTVTNRGQEASASTAVRIVLSRDRTYSPNDALLGELSLCPIQPGDSLQLTRAITIPSAGGGRYLVGYADPQNVVDESHETNNSRWALCP